MKGNSKIKLAAFDWNGTILSDTNVVVRAEMRLMDKLGLPGHSIKRAREHFMIPIRDYWISLGSTGEFFDKHEKEIADLFYEYYEAHIDNCRTRAGTKEMLSWLHDRKIQTVIFSNHSVEGIKKHLTRLKLVKYFDVILARPPGDVSHMRAQSKDIKLSSYVKFNGIKPSQVVTVGDTVEEIQIGEKYGYHSVALTGGNQSTKRLRAAKPDFLIHNLTELKKIIEKL